ncbi:DNA-binding protein [Streptomyces oceani]|uniref:DNA-binding protein n=1 Tax=Streptomyces oceani TaxID=1075402 RepID=UPI000A4FC246|nr:DNA-binding protein [Streptomyces oceani]
MKGVNGRAIPGFRCSRAADVFRIPLERLLADDTTPEPSRVFKLPTEVAALVDSLYASAHDGNIVDLAELRRRITFCCQAWASCHYAAAARDLPGVLADAHRSAVSRGEASALLSRAYQLVASLLFKYGELARTPAVLAADRALRAAEASGDPIAMAAAARRVARGLIHQQRHTTAADYATATAADLRPHLERSGVAGLSALGMLYLVAAVGATGEGRSRQAVAAATESLGEATQVAEQQGGEGADFTSFGPTNVELHEVDVLLRLDDAWSAIEAAQRIDTGAISALGRERQARHLVTTARASALTRSREDAVRDLLEAERLAPEEMRRPSVTRLIGELTELVSAPGPELTGLARRCGLRA